MSDYDNTNTGALFVNEDKDEGHPKWPDRKGRLNVNGVDYWLSGWLKTSKSGKKYLQLKLGDEKGGTKPKEKIYAAKGELDVATQP